MSQPILLGYGVVALQGLQCDLLFGHAKMGNTTMNPELPEGLQVSSMALGKANCGSGGEAMLDTSSQP